MDYKKKYLKYKLKYFNFKNILKGGQTDASPDEVADMLNEQGDRVRMYNKEGGSGEGDNPDLREYVKYLNLSVPELQQQLEVLAENDLIEKVKQLENENNDLESENNDLKSKNNECEQELAKRKRVIMEYKRKLEFVEAAGGFNIDDL